MECSDGSIIGRVGCILGYNGNTKDIVLNYVVLVINLVYCIAAAKSHRMQQKKRLYKSAFASLVFTVVFQISLCLTVGCSGVSIIWCTMAGWNMSERRRAVEVNQEASSSSLIDSSDRLASTGQLVILLDLIVIFYYTFAAPFLTTVAHLLALILGAVLSIFSMQYCAQATTGAAQPLMLSRR